MKRIFYLIIAFICIGVLCACSQTSEWKKPISVEKAIKIAQKYIDKTDKIIVTNYDNPTVDVIVGYENLLMVEPKSQKWKYVDQNKIIGRELYRIIFGTENADEGPLIIYVDKNKGVLLGLGIIM